MARTLPHRLPALLVATAAASALAAAPALATEGPAAPPPASTLPTGVAPLTFSPFPSATAPAARNSRLIRRARLVHSTVRRGKRAVLRVSLATPSKLRVVLTRRPSGHRIRTLSQAAKGSIVSMRLPARTGGHALRAGRYRVRVVAIDANGTRSAPVKLSMKVRG